jgi:hypothetical protein
MSTRYSSTAPDSGDHLQDAALLAFLDSDANPATKPWRKSYFWVDWACIEQDDVSQRERMIKALPLYLRCCNMFIGLNAGAYWRRAWCRLEVVGSSAAESRIMLNGSFCEGSESSDGTAAAAASGSSCDYCDSVEAVPGTEVALQAKMGGKPEDGECFLASDRPLIERIVRKLKQMTRLADHAIRNAAQASSARQLGSIEGGRGKQSHDPGPDRGVGKVSVGASASEGFGQMFASISKVSS